ncbi:MAG: transporter, partial [Nitrospirae bacterium]|nr:transporter [Fimbriimonadaceae bacterium]
MAQFLSEQPLLLLFLVLGLGYPLGRLRLFGTRLGVGAVLFVGLAFGALGPEVAAPEVLVQLGLVLFIYTLGLSSAPAFFASLRRSWLPNVLVLGVIAFVGFGLLVLSRTHLLDRDAAVGL